MSSHGGSGSDKCEPNLIPLLDMVLQLVMFFMLVANFVMEELTATIQLPDSTQAQVVEHKEPNPIYLDVDKEGKYVLLEEAGKGTLDKIELNDAQDAKLKLENRFKIWRDAGAKPPAPVLIIRADKAAPYGKLYDVMLEAQKAGFADAMVRTRKPGTIGEEK